MTPTFVYEEDTKAKAKAKTTTNRPLAIDTNHHISSTKNFDVEKFILSAKNGW